jgi:hypothetical protein
MTTINTALVGDTKQGVEFRLPLTVWHEEQMEVPVISKTKWPSATEQRHRRFTFILRMARLKSLQREERANQLKGKTLCGLSV